jgi:hypothetical protein
MTTTPPPSPEAVEAAMQWLNGNTKAVTGEKLEMLHHYYGKPSMGASWNAARILAAEVERLRAQADAVCEWPLDKVTEEYDTDCGRSFRCVVYGWDGVPGYCPGCGRKVKIQPNTNEQ